jgi:hypothetical protein
MSRRKTLDIASMQFYKFDKWILAEESLKKLSLTAKVLYMLIKDREEISIKNADKFTDEEGYLFQYFDQVKVGELMGISKNAVIKAFKDLQEYKLIEVVRQGQGKPNRIYVLDYEVSEDTLKELSYENKKASTVPPVKATNTNKNNIDTNIIPQNNKKYSPKNKENKNNTGKGASANVNNTFEKYNPKELESMLKEGQKGKFDKYKNTEEENRVDKVNITNENIENKSNEEIKQFIPQCDYKYMG